MKKITIDSEIKERLRLRGVECFYTPGQRALPEGTSFEAPCGIKWIDIQSAFFSIGCFSYAVSGYYNNVSIGRYCSFGEGVQMGRGDHSISWLSTNPAFYSRDKLFDVGGEFNGAAEYAHFRPDISGAKGFIGGSLITIEHDVWIGHEAYLRPGITIGTGAIIGAKAVVTRNVEPYAVVVGNPGRVVRYRFDEALIARLLETKWWNFAPWQLEGIDVSRPEVSIDGLERRCRGTPAFLPTSFTLGELTGGDGGPRA